MSIACLLGSLLQLAACTENADGSYATAQTESVAASNYQTQTSSSVDAQGQAKMAAWVPQPETYDIGTQNNLTVPMKDGTILRVMVKYPVDRTTGAPAVGAFPALLTQTPYGKNSPLYTTLGGGSEDYLVKRGYIAVVADVRGRGASEGEFDFWGYQERLDSLELADWAARLPNSNGKVGLFGGSYMGITQLHTASVAGPNSPIKAAIPEVVISNVGRDGYYGGMPNLGFGLLYAVLFPTTGLTGIIDYIGVNDPGDLLTRTQQALSGSLSVAAPLVLDQVLDGPAAHAGEFWDFRSPGTNLDDIANSGIAIMLVGGWYDVMGKGPSMIYTGLQNASAGRPVGLPMKADQIPNPRYQWLQGPWTHTGTMPSDLVAQVRLRWFDRWLKNVDNGIDQTSTPIHFNVLGTDRWVDAKTWPLKETTSTVFYFGGRGHSNAPSLNDGSLSSIKPVDALASDQVFWTGVSSPCSVRLKIQTAGLLEMIPVPLDEKVCGSGSEETTQLGALTYTTEPFASDKVIAGPIGLTLYASSSGFDAEFIVGVSKVTADGTPVSMASGGLLGSQRAQDKSLSWYSKNGDPVQPFHYFLQDSDTPLTPFKVERFEIGVWPTAFQVNKGERLRITVSTSDIPFAMPMYPTVLNLVGTSYLVQRSKVYPSSVTVPLADLSAFQRNCVICSLK